MRYDVIVIGAGNAGIEAATASARMNAKTLLITTQKSNIGELSCNPSIGGIGKGTIVKEVDALDGVMAQIADFATIHKKTLNATKGHAVHGPRVQIDRTLYKQKAFEILNHYPNLDIKYAMVEEIIKENNEITGVITTENEQIFCTCVVITTGTFLGGTIIIGEKRFAAGRINEKPSNKLAEWIHGNGFSPMRLKTGTPPRLDIHTINFDILEKQPSEDYMNPMSYINSINTNKQLDCYITYTNPESHEILKRNFHRSVVANGDLKSKGPRYCPSIEQKIMRFDRQRHHIFLEPEGYDSELIYPNGLSSAMPEDVQIDFLHSIKGLENVKMIQPAYTIEYFYIDPMKCRNTLETKNIHGLFLAGQILGTTGYEEAAGLGLIAGVNAALKAKKSNQEFILDRSESLIGVMIDDLITKGVDGEPYRMFTSRAEYRLNIRSDNADTRLTPIGIKFGLITQNRISKFQTKINLINQIITNTQNISFTPSELEKYFDIKLNQDGVKRTLYKWSQNKALPDGKIIEIYKKYHDTDENILKQFLIQARYQPYLERQEQEILEMKAFMSLKIPDNFSFESILSLSNEVVEKLNKNSPSTVYEASCISGITPAAINALIVAIKNLH